MEKHIPRGKLSKKEKRKLDARKRSTWGPLNPVTRKPVNSRAYNRKKAQDWRKDPFSPVFFAVSGVQTMDREGTRFRIRRSAPDHTSVCCRRLRRCPTSVRKSA